MNDLELWAQEMAPHISERDLARPDPRPAVLGWWDAVGRVVLVVLPLVAFGVFLGWLI